MSMIHYLKGTSPRSTEHELTGRFLAPLSGPAINSLPDQHGNTLDNDGEAPPPSQPKPQAFGDLVINMRFPFAQKRINECSLGRHIGSPSKMVAYQRLGCASEFPADHEVQEAGRTALARLKGS